MGYKISDFKHNSLYDRINKLLVSYEWSDCSFEVCGKVFKAHKLILAISSPVFEAMFYGPLSTNDSIIITDIETHTFQLLLNFIYTDKVEIGTIEEAYDLLYASKKYLLDTLSEICLEYIQSNLSIDNVVKILNYPDYMQEYEIDRSALNLFYQHAYYLLHEHKADISITTLRKILDSNEINITEKDLIKIAFAWTYEYSVRYQLNTDLFNRRELLIQTGLFSLLRFSTLSINDLENIKNDQHNLLLPQEIEIIKKVITNTLSVSDNTKKCDTYLSVIHVPRKPVKINWLLCHRALIRSETPITIDSHNNCIESRLKADKSFFIHSLKIQSRMSTVANFFNSINIYNENLIISVLYENDNSIIRQFNFKKDIEYDSNVDIEFTEPLCLQKDKWYTIRFNWPNLSPFDTYSYSVESRDLSYIMLYNNKIKFEFEDNISSISDTTGSFLKGFTFCL